MGVGRRQACVQSSNVAGTWWTSLSHLLHFITHSLPLKPTTAPQRQCGPQPGSEHVCELLTGNRGLQNEQHGCRSACRKPTRRHRPLRRPGVKTTHDAIILPEVVGCTVGIYNGKTFNQVEIKPEMTSHSLGGFSITYNPGTSGPPICPNSVPLKQPASQKRHRHL